MKTGLVRATAVCAVRNASKLLIVALQGHLLGSLFLLLYANLPSPVVLQLHSLIACERR